MVAGLLVRGNRVLLCHRSESRRWYPSLWDLPGGHVEARETPGAALVRELEEELGISVQEPRGDGVARVTTAEFDMRVWLVTEWSGSPQNASGEHDELRWCELAEARTLNLAHECLLTIISDAIAPSHR